jgi:hypothetical protein
MQNEPFGPSLEPFRRPYTRVSRRGKAFCGGRLVAELLRRLTQRGQTSGSPLCRRLRLNGWAASLAGRQSVFALIVSLASAEGAQRLRAYGLEVVVVECGEPPAGAA